MRGVLGIAPFGSLGILLAAAATGPAVTVMPAVAVATTVSVVEPSAGVANPPVLLSSRSEPSAVSSVNARPTAPPRTHSPPTPSPTPTPTPCNGECYLVGAGSIGSSGSLEFANLSVLRLGGSEHSVLVPAAKNPDVNAQGTEVVLERYPGYVWIMNVDGSSLRPLSPQTGGGWMEPRFEPDGRHVVTTHDLGNGVNEIFEIDSATGEFRQLTNAPRYPWKWRPNVDPSGAHLVVTYGSDSNSTSGPSSHVGIAVLPPPGATISDFSPLTPVNTIRPSYDGEISPDGTHLIFDAGGRIWVALADGSGATSVAPGKLGRFDRTKPGQILFTQDLNGNGTHTPLMAAAVDGTGAHMVVDGNFAESFSSFPG